MSYQSIPPVGGTPPADPVPTFHTPPPPPPPPPAPPSPAKGSRRRGLVGLGVVVLLGGLVAGGVLFALSVKATNDTVKKFARAPLGCTTTLQFEKKAVFTIYVETKGAAIDVGGDCAASASPYDRTDTSPPTVSLSLVDDQDATVDMTDSTAYSYDTGDYKGAAVQQVSIGKPGTYRLTVESKDDNFAIAIGGDPDVDSRRLKYVGAASVAAGLVLGVLLLVVGMRRRTPPANAAAPAAVWVPGSVPPPPTFHVPPNAAPPTSAPPPPGFHPPPPDGGWGAPPR